MNNGRIEIFTDLIPNGDVEHDKKIIPIILDEALNKHSLNKTDQERLIDYYYNKTDIEYKTKVQQSTINNKVAIPYANIAVTTINSYCFSTPFTRNSRNGDDKVTQMLKAFNDALDDDSYDSKTAETELNSGSCGLGYKFVRPANAEERKQGIWFKTFGDLDPNRTFVVKSNGIDKEKVLACTYFGKREYDSKNEVFVEKTVYNVYTKYHYWIFEKGGTDRYTVQLQDLNGVKIEAFPLLYNRIPIIEYPRKQDRTSDFEIGLSLIDSINNLASSRVDDVQQAVDYILLLRDIATDTDEDIANITKAVSKGILSFRSVANAVVQPDVKVLDTQLHQSEVQTLQDFLCHKVEEALNIPNRETRGSSGDTGLAVESRAGYRSLENIAGLITLCAKKSETETLDVILAICSMMEGCPFAGLTINDIEIKSNRNKVENITNASNAYATLRSAGMNDQDALSVTQIVPDSIGTAERNKKEAEENMKRQQEQLAQQKKMEGNNPVSTDDSDKNESKSTKDDATK